MVRNVTHTYTETKGLVRIQEGGLVGAVPSIPHTLPIISPSSITRERQEKWLFGCLSFSAYVLFGVYDWLDSSTDKRRLLPALPNRSQVKYLAPCAYI
jgi:hypothetical protein